MTDAEREQAIQSLRLELTEAHAIGDMSRARVVWEELRATIRERSAGQVERMERERGLR